MRRFVLFAATTRRAEFASRDSALHLALIHPTTDKQSSPKFGAQAPAYGFPLLIWETLYPSRPLRHEPTVLAYLQLLRETALLVVSDPSVVPKRLPSDR